MAFRYRLSSGSVLIPAVMILFLTSCGQSPGTTTATVIHLDGTPNDLCLKDSVSRSQKGDEIKLTCDLRPMELQFLATDAPPGAVFAKVECSCGDSSSGSLACARCTCQEDEVSNCDSFLAWCTATGGEALGGGDIGICNKPEP